MIRLRFSALYWRIRHRLGRTGRAFAYAAGTLSAGQAQDIIADCEFAAGHFPVMTLAVQDVMDMAIKEYGDQAHALKPYLPGACAHAASKFECYGDEYWHVCNRALGAAKASAAQDGLRLVSETEDYFNTPASQEGEQAHA